MITNDLFGVTAYVFEYCNSTFWSFYAFGKLYEVTIMQMLLFIPFSFLTLKVIRDIYSLAVDW